MFPLRVSHKKNCVGSFEIIQIKSPQKIERKAYIVETK